MLTRREKLLVRPWQLRRFNHHRNKVLAAHPVIDFGPPPQRDHVSHKLKKLQKEHERRSRIEEDNFRLLQRMGVIMKKNHLDNYWKTEPPNFLRKVGIYHQTRSPSPCEELTPVTSPDIVRKSRCSACVDQKKKKHLEERKTLPEMLKNSRCKKESISTTLIITTLDQSSTNSKTEHSARGNTTWTSTKVKTLKPGSHLPEIGEKTGLRTGHISEKRMMIKQGSLRLMVNFPTHVDVKIKSTQEDISKKTVKYQNNVSP